MKRKFAYSVVMLCLFLLCTSLGAFAAEQAGTVKEGFFDGLDYSALSSQPTVQLYSTIDEEAVKEDILTALQNIRSGVNLSSYDITVRKATELYMGVVWSHPELFYVNTVFGYRYLPEENKDKLDCKVDVLIYNFATTSNPKATYATYASDRAAIAEKREGIDAEVDKILASIDPDMSDAEKALVVHDWFALHYSYDTPASEVGAPTAAHRIDGLFIDKKAVCQGYALGYMYVLDMLEIESVYVRSTYMKHAWNMVEIDGKWYHVDVTWDDPTVGEAGDIVGLVTHNNFLRSDAGITDTGHSDWTASHTASEDYEGFWKIGEKTYVNGGMFYNDGKWYYVVEDDIVAYDPSGEKPTTLKTDIAVAWEDKEGRAQGINLGIYNDHIYYNSYAEIYCMDLDGTDEHVYLKPDRGEAKIFGLKIDAGILHYGLTENPAESVQLVEKEMNWFATVPTKDGLEFKIYKAPGTGQLFLAMYKENELIYMDVRNFTDETEECTFELPVSTADKACVYVWDGITPLDDVITLD